VSSRVPIFFAGSLTVRVGIGTVVQASNLKTPHFHCLSWQNAKKSRPPPGELVEAALNIPPRLGSRCDVGARLYLGIKRVRNLEDRGRCLER